MDYVSAKDLLTGGVCGFAVGVYHHMSATTIAADRTLQKSVKPVNNICIFFIL